MIIQSILDNDTYKASMQNFILKQYPEATASYKFHDRDNRIKMDLNTFHMLEDELHEMKNLKLTDLEYDWIKKKIYFLDISYRQYLSSYRYNPDLVKLSLKDGKLDITIEGKWRETVMWEVPLMAIISELYFREIDKDWVDYDDRQIKIANEKAKSLLFSGCKFADFGTRRRRSYISQNILVREASQYSNFIGSSNMHFSRLFNKTPTGTQGHEIIQAISGLEGLRHANRFMLQKWESVFLGNLGVALTDTFGLESFLQDFSLRDAKAWDGVRHDSGCPFRFIDKMIEHYKKLRIDPTTKTLVFSDGLDIEKTIKIKEYCSDMIRCSFGIGTHLTNDYLKQDGTKSKPLNMVIKLDKINNISVVKLSDTPSKAVGDKDALRVAKWTFFGEEL